MKKILLGLGSVAAVVAPIAAVVACNDDDATKAELLFHAENEKFPKWYETSKWNETETYPRAVYLAKQDSDAIKKLLEVKDGNDVNFTIASMDTTLTNLESMIKSYILTELKSDDKDGQFTSFIAEEKLLEGNSESQITIGTFPSIDSQKDDMVAVAINGLSKPLVKKLMSNFKKYFNGQPKPTDKKDLATFNLVTTLLDLI